MVYLLNSAIIVDDGTYTYKTVKAGDVKAFIGDQDFISYIGYPDTAKFLSSIIGRHVPTNRGMISMNVGDVAVVCKLKYRVQDPKTKGAFTPGPDDYTFGILKRIG